MIKSNLAETVKFCFTSRIIGELSSLVDETEPGVETALGRSVPLVLGHLLNHAERNLSPSQLLDLVRDTDSADVLARLAAPDAVAAERSTNLLLDLLGDTYRSTVNQIAVAAGIRPRASGTLLQTAALAVLGVLGKFAAENGLTPDEFVQWLRSQQHAIGAAMLPAGRFDNSPPDVLARQPAASPPRIATVPARPAPRPPAAVAAPVTSAGRARRWPWALLLLLLAAVGLGYFLGTAYFGRNARPPANETTTAARLEKTSAPVTAEVPVAEVPSAPLQQEKAATPLPPAAAMPATPSSRPAVVTARPGAAGGRYDQDRDTYIYDTGRPIVLSLANGTVQKVGANSTENRLYTFLATAAAQVDSVNRTKGWINFDRVDFEPGQATLQPQSWGQLHNVARILRTFPNAVVKIGGYTDSAGVALRNLELSEARARTAMLALANLGVPLERLQAKGYGAKYFVAPNTTAEGRALNRRVSVRVVKK